MTAKSRRLAPLLCLALLLALGCETTPASPDAGVDAAADAGADASAPDAAAPPSVYCQPCRVDPMCGEGGLCTIGEGPALACAPPCAGDEDCAALAPDARCEEPIPGLGRVCMPAEGDCVRASAGQPCSEAETCAGLYPVCESGLDPRGAFCTRECRSDADCPVGLRRCTAHLGRAVCVPDRPAARVACEALIAAAGASPCGAGRSCPMGGRCYGTEPLALCLSAAPAGGCAAGTVARSIGGASVCVPTSALWGDDLADCECALSDDTTMLDQGLALVERTRCDLAYPTWLLEPLHERNPTLRAIDHDRFRLSAIDTMHASWTHVPRWGRELGARFDAAAASAQPMTRALAEAARAADFAPDEARAPMAGALATELAGLMVAAGATPDMADIDAQVGSLPAAVRDRLAPIVAALAQVLAVREASLAIYEEDQRERLFELASAFHLGGIGRAAPATAAWVQGALLGDVDVRGMALASLALSAAIEDADLTSLAGMSASLTLETPMGRIAIRGAADDTYEEDAWAQVLFLLELGGDDTYRAPVGATASVGQGAALLIDVAGSDLYGYLEVPHARDVGPAGHERLVSDAAGRNDPAAGASDGPWSRSTTARQGAGRLGVGFLVDLGTSRDEYRSHRMSQGYGALGVGVLFDAGGDDLYHGEAGVQGSASFGLGLLIDAGGDDRYVAYNSAQGFAYSRAVGALYDAAGNDEYLAHPSDVLYWSPQSPGMSNSSFCQGAGFGRRADFSDGVFMSGGIALLRDARGDDRYTVGIFGQATGYWFGAGFLLDGAGADRYDGEWYVQAGDAHFGIAALIDEGPERDLYNETATRRNAAHGGGHDFSVAWLIDTGGDDLHRAPGLSMGTGHAGGFGGFVDLGGDDTYDVTRDLAFGHASIETTGDPLRRLTGTRGLFLERGGVDSYTRPMLGELANDATWTQRAHAPDDEELGAGLDRSSGEVGLPGFEGR